MKTWPLKLVLHFLNWVSTNPWRICPRHSVKQQWPLTPGKTFLHLGEALIQTDLKCIPETCSQLMSGSSWYHHRETRHHFPEPPTFSMCLLFVPFISLLNNRITALLMSLNLFVVFLLCKSLWIKASSNWININQMLETGYWQTEDKFEMLFCLSLFSISRRRRQNADSPEPSSVSVKSSISIELPPEFSEGQVSSDSTLVYYFTC